MTDKQRLALLQEAVGYLERTQQGYVAWEAAGKPKTHWRAAIARLEQLEADLAPSKVPSLGPIRPGGKSLLQYSLTHKTSGVPLHPAFDDNWGVGAVGIAPEPLVVIAPYTSANPGAAFYARGASKIEYWVGHLTKSPRIGTRYAKGQEIGRAVAIAGDDDEHIHWGINVEALLGAGKQLLYGATGRGPDYTFGSPTIGAQLEAQLEASA